MSPGLSRRYHLGLLHPPGKRNLLTSIPHQLLPWQKSRLRLPRIKREAGVEDQSYLGQGDKTTWQFRGCESEIQT